MRTHQPTDVHVSEALILRLIPGASFDRYNYKIRDTRQRVPGSNVGEAPPGPDEDYIKHKATWQYDPNADGLGNADWRLFLERASHLGSTLGQLVV